MFRWPYFTRLIAIETQIKTLQEKIMASLADVMASQAAEDAQIKALIIASQTAQASFASASAQITALQAQIAAGQAVSPTDLDAIKADMDAQATAIGAALAPQPAPAPATASAASPAP